jgi:hypothetical protein
MIETEEQRRWWFATHPEYSWSRRGIRGYSGRENGNKVDPEEVDRYVDNALKYETGSVADLLRSVKRNFGTEADSRKGGQYQGILAGHGGESSVSLTGYHVDGGVFMPRLPTTQELFQWPREMARQFFRVLDALLQNNPLIIDPNALERHHGLPKAFVNYFLDCGLKIEEFIMIMRAADHRLKPDGLHTGKGRGGDWIREWDEFIEDHPARNTEKRQTQIRIKLDEMVKKYGIDKKILLSPSKPKR